MEKMTNSLNKVTSVDELYSVLKRPFSVIIFDIDGVLAEHAGSVSDKLIEKLVSLLNRGIYVNLVSGRPLLINKELRSKGCRDITEIFHQIRHSNKLDNSDNLKYLFSFEQNGSAISDGYEISDNRKKPFDLKNPTMDKGLQQEIWKYFLSTKQDHWFYYAENKSHGMALWLCENAISEGQNNIVKAIVEECLSHFKVFDKFELFQTGNTIDIGAIGVSKASAVAFYIEAGFSLEQIVRIGDSTYSGGNDQPMVIYNGIGDNGGFSVEHYDELESFPVVSLPKIIKKNGVEATHWLLDNIQWNENQPYLF